MEEGKAEPGASRHGNFINYYQFHPAEERVRQLPKAVCRAASGRSKFVGLDVGCNAGDLTLQLHQFLEDNLPGCEVHILAVDLDRALVDRAREKNDRPDRVTFECLDFLSEEREAVLGAYLARHRLERFDASFCFSITMWIHLNGGDAALEGFLEDVCGTSEALLLEPQPWRCYRQASRRLRRADLADFPQLAGLRYRGDVAGHIDRILTERCAFRRLELTEANDWQRRLMLYERIPAGQP